MTEPRTKTLNEFVWELDAVDGNMNTYDSMIISVNGTPLTEADLEVDLSGGPVEDVEAAMATVFGVARREPKPITATWSWRWVGTDDGELPLHRFFEAIAAPFEAITLGNYTFELAGVLEDMGQEAWVARRDYGGHEARIILDGTKKVCEMARAAAEMISTGRIDDDGGVEIQDTLLELIGHLTVIHRSDEIPHPDDLAEEFDGARLTIEGWMP